MKNKDFSREIRNINRRIRNIKAHEMQPITLKSPADLISIYIHKKGTNKEGEFRSYEEMKKYYPNLSEADYISDISGFIHNKKYEEQLKVSGSYDYYRESGMIKLEQSGKFDEEMLEKFRHLTNVEFVEMFNTAGLMGDIEKSRGGSSEYFYTFINDFIDEVEKMRDL